jgi:hypothetical protein
MIRMNPVPDASFNRCPATPPPYDKMGRHSARNVAAETACGTSVYDLSGAKAATGRETISAWAAAGRGISPSTQVQALASAINAHSTA